VELPLIDVLADMEYTGVKVDVCPACRAKRRIRPAFAGIGAGNSRLGRSRVQHRLAQAVARGSFRGTRLPVVKKTPKTGPSTDAEVLEQLARLHPLPAKLLEYRQYAKLKSTYVDALPGLVHPATGRVHASSIRWWLPRAA